MAAVILVSLLSTTVGATTEAAPAEVVSAKAAATYGPDIANQLGDLAVNANSSIQAIADRVGALEQKVRQAREWMDPPISAEYGGMPIDDPVPGQHPISGVQLMLRQTFYWPGRVSAREAEADQRIRQERLTLAEQRLQLRASVKLACSSANRWGLWSVEAHQPGAPTGLLGPFPGPFPAPGAPLVRSVDSVSSRRVSPRHLASSTSGQLSQPPPSPPDSAGGGRAG